MSRYIQAEGTATVSVGAHFAGLLCPDRGPSSPQLAAAFVLGLICLVVGITTHDTEPSEVETELWLYGENGIRQVRGCDSFA